MCLWIHVQGFITWAKKNLYSGFLSLLRGLPPQPPKPAFLGDAAFAAPCGSTRSTPSTTATRVRPLGLYKKLFHLEAFVHESIIRLLPSPTCIAHTIAIPFHDYCAISNTPPDPPLYAIHHTILIMTISCKGQTPPHSPPSLRHFVTQRLQPPVAVLGCGFSFARVWLCEDGSVSTFDWLRVSPTKRPKNQTLSGP